MPHLDEYSEAFRLKAGQILKSSGLKKSDRILKHSGYVRLSASGKAVRDQYFIIAFAKSREGRTRLGITASKRVGNAVVRNRLKRIIREIFRISRNLIDGHWDINVIAKKDAAGLSYQEALQALKRLFCKIDG
jgi:ribonuclease P protein component